MSIVEFLSQPVWQRLGLTLVHFLWQGLAVAVLVGVLVRVFRLNHGNARYAAYLLAFAAMIVCPVVTFTVIDIPISPNAEFATETESTQVVDNVSYTALPAGDILPEAETSSPALPTLTDSIPLGQRISDWLNVSMPWILVIWMVGVVVLSVRLLMGFVGVYRWRHHLKPLPEWLAQRIASLTERLGMQGFSRVFISPTVLQAMAVGYLRPMVLLPAAMVTQMQPEMLEAVIAHELAHIRRFDLWVNLVQRVTETLLFYHPAVWWLSICLRSERELCCDELAVKATGERITYASTLESVGRARFVAKPPILAAGLGQDNKPTLGRVRHILGLTPTQRNCPFWLAGVIAVVFLAALVIPTTLALTSRANEQADIQEKKGQKELSKFKTTLANGVTVELVGTCEYPSAGKQWWRPDGTPFTLPAGIKVEDSISKARVGDNAYQFLFRYNSQEDLTWNSLDAVCLHFAIEGHSDTNLINMRRLPKGGQDGLVAKVAIFKEPLDSTTIQANLATGNWQTKAVRDISKIDQRNEDLYWFTSETPRTGNVSLDILHRIEGQQIKTIAIDREGNEYDASYSLGSFGGWMSVSAIIENTPKDVRGYIAGITKDDRLVKFKLQSRPYWSSVIGNVSLKPNFKTDVQIEVEKPAGQVVVEGIRANRDKFECGILAWSSKRIDTRYEGPRGNLSGQYELWWDGKKIATKYVHDQVYTDPTGRFWVDKRQGGNSYDGSLLSRKPRFNYHENWLGPVTRWRGDGSQDWLIRQDSKQEGISKDWSVVDNNGVKLIRAITRNMNKTARDYRAYSIRDYDSSKGYGLVNEEWYNPDGSQRLKHTVKLQEVIPGGWFPVEVDFKSFAITDGKVYSHQNYALDIERCSFNDKSALPDRVFKGAVDKQLEYQEKLQKYLAMELEGISDVKEAAKADRVKRGAREAIEKFVAAALAGDFEKARQFADPDKAPADQVADIPEIVKGQNLWIMAVVADDFDAIAVSSVIRGDHERIGPLVFFLDRKPQDGRDNWWVDDIDMETPDGVEVELKQFLEKHPKAQKVPYENKPAVQVEGEGESTTGWVVDGRGHGIAGVTMWFYQRDTKEKKSTRRQTIQTRKDGSFVIPFIELGEHGSFTNITAPGFDTRMSVNVERGIDGTFYPDGLKIKLYRLVSIAGRVYDINGKPLAGAPLSLSTTVQYPSQSEATSNHFRAITDENGRFVMMNVPPGVHLLYYPWSGPSKAEVEKGIWDAYIKTGERYPSAPIKGVLSAQVIEVREGEKIGEVVVDLSQSTCSVTGQVHDTHGRVVADAMVSLYWVHSGGWGSVNGKGYPPVATDAEGRYRLQNLPPGDWHIKTWHDQVKQQSKPVPIELKPGRTIQQDLALSGQPELDAPRTDVQVEGESEVSKLLASLEDEKYAHTRGGIIPLVEENGQELLDKLRSYDSAFLNSQTISMEMEKPVNWARADERQKIKIALTTDNGSIGWEEEISYLSGPRYREGLNGIDRIQYVWNVTRKQGLIENDFQARRREMVLLLVSPWGDFAEKEAAPVVEFMQPSDRTTFIEYTCVIWSTGRGFAGHLERIIEAKEDENGLIHFTAYGNFGPNSGVGLWGMVVDPKSGYLVRSASFTIKGHESPVFICTTMGTKWFDNCSLAKEARFSTWDKSKITTTQTVQFKLEPDAKLFDKLRKTLRSELPKDTRVEDCR